MSDKTEIIFIGGPRDGHKEKFHIGVRLVEGLNEDRTKFRYSVEMLIIKGGGETGSIRVGIFLKPMEIKEVEVRLLEIIREE